MASTTCMLCPDGYFSDVGYEFCQPIPAGFQRNIVASSSITLEPCAEGFYSDWGYTNCIVCPDGFLCPSGGDIGVHYGCPKGSFCVRGKQTKCNPGYYGLIERARTQNEGCYVCP